MPKLLWAFLVRDFHEITSYRLSFLLDLGSIFFRAFTFFFVSQLLGDSVAPMLAAYNGDYFAFVIIGLALVHALVTGFDPIGWTLLLTLLALLLFTRNRIPLEVSSLLLLALTVLGFTLWRARRAA